MCLTCNSMVLHKNGLGVQFLSYWHFFKFDIPPLIHNEKFLINLATAWWEIPTYCQQLSRSLKTLSRLPWGLVSWWSSVQADGGPPLIWLQPGFQKTPRPTAPPPGSVTQLLILETKATVLVLKWDGEYSRAGRPFDVGPARLTAGEHNAGNAAVMHTGVGIWKSEYRPHP